MKLRTKFSLLISLLVIIIVLGVTVSLLISESRFLVKEMETSRVNIVKSLAQVAKESLTVKDEILLLNYLKAIKNTRGLKYAMITDPQNKILAHTDINLYGKQLDDAPADKARQAGGLLAQNYTGADNEPVLDLAYPVLLGETRAGTARIGFSQQALNQSVQETLSAARRRILMVGIIALLAGLIGALIWTRMMTDPIKILAQGAVQIGQGKLSHRINIKTKDELGDLAAEFNRMGDKLSELDRLKSDFVSSVTHELRSPLLSLRLYIDLFLKGTAGSVNDKQKEYLDIMKNCSLRLSRFIDDLLDMAKIERGKLDISIQPLDIPFLINEIAQLYKPQFDEKKVRFNMNLPEQLPQAKGDPDRTRQVLMNLLSNAVKFTPSGGSVTVGANHNLSSKTIDISVTDTGSGIPADKLEKIFDKFEQVKDIKSKAQKPKGTGLGLAIVKGIMESQGGKISVKSELGKGSEFTFSLVQA